MGRGIKIIIFSKIIFVTVLFQKIILFLQVLVGEIL
jgi:hypothetical protein